MEYRVLAEPIQVNGSLVGTVIVAVPLDPLHHTLGRLVLIELLVSIGVLGGVGALAWWMVRRNLRPLDEMATTAGAIAGGDLSQRVMTTDERTEVGQLGNALNTMLSGIEGAFAARAASEERLRRFLADASHELRTPLTSIRGYAELFDRGARDRPEDLATSMRHIREEANRMSTLVDDLLLLARLDHQRPLVLERMDLTATVTAAVGAARVSTPDRAITLEVPGPIPVVGDADRLRQVVDNLLANAVQHTPDGSPVDVRVSTEAATARLEISDKGPGIPLAEQAHIFEPFHRADPHAGACHRWCRSGTHHRVGHRPRARRDRRGGVGPDLGQREQRHHLLGADPVGGPRTGVRAQGPRPPRRRPRTRTRPGALGAGRHRRGAIGRTGFGSFDPATDQVDGLIGRIPGLSRDWVRNLRTARPGQGSEPAVRSVASRPRSRGQIDTKALRGGVGGMTGDVDPVGAGLDDPAPARGVAHGETRQRDAHHDFGPGP